MRIILRERLRENSEEKKGWLIILARTESHREILAVLQYEVGLEYAQNFASMLATKYNLAAVSEELSSTPGF